jgi:MFS family permease
MFLSAFRQMARAARGFSRPTRLFLAGSFLMGLGQGAIGAHLNLYLKAAGLSEAAIGQVLSATSMGMVVVSVPAALWVDTFRPARIFAAAAAGFAATVALMVFFPDPRILVPLAFLDGALFTVHVVAVGPFFMRTEPVEHRTELFGLNAALETLAMTVAAFGTGHLAHRLGGLLGSEQAGLRWGLVAAGACALLAVIPFAAIGTGPLSPTPRRWRDYVVSRDQGLLLKLTLPGFILGCGAGLTIPFLNLYFHERFGKGPASIGTYYSVASLLTMAGFLAGPALARRFGHVRAAVATELLSIPFFFVLATTSRLEYAVAAFWMRGALMTMNQPVSNAFALEIVPEDQRVVTNSMRTFAWNSSWMVSTATGGLLIQVHGFAPGMYVTMGLYLLAAALFWTFFRGRVVPSGAAAPASPVATG